MLEYRIDGVILNLIDITFFDKAIQMCKFNFTIISSYGTTFLYEITQDIINDNLSKPIRKHLICILNFTKISNKI